MKQKKPKRDPELAKYGVQLSSLTTWELICLASARDPETELERELLRRLEEHYGT